MDKIVLLSGDNSIKQYISCFLDKYPLVKAKNIETNDCRELILDNMTNVNCIGNKMSYENIWGSLKKKMLGFEDKINNTIYFVCYFVIGEGKVTFESVAYVNTEKFYSSRDIFFDMNKTEKLKNKHCDYTS